MKEVQVDGSLTNKVGESLRSAIVSGELAPGELYSVHDLADVLGVSRTPVREALIRLASKGMVRFERNRGVRILQTTVRDLEEVFELRLLLEVPAVRLAVARLQPSDLAELRQAMQLMHTAAAAGDEPTLTEQDRRFHAVLLEASGNQRLVALVDSLRDLVLTRGVSTARTSRTLQDIADEHVAILEAVDVGDADGAAAALYRHILHTARLLIVQEFDASTATVDAWAAEVGHALDRHWNSAAAQVPEGR